MLYDISVKLIVMLVKFDTKIKNVKFEKNSDIKKVNQSVVILVFTVIFFT